MAQAKDYYKIVPNSIMGSGTGMYQVRNNPKSTFSPSGVASSQTQSFKHALKFTTNRQTKYVMYDQMDKDVDISRALDTLADEMTPLNTDTNLPFNIYYNNNIDEEVDEEVVVTLRAAEQRWSRIYKLDNRLWGIIRYILKYGDAFFLKCQIDGELHPRWKFIDNRDVLGISRCSESNDIIHYQISHTCKALSKDQRDQMRNNQKNGIAILKSDIVHFSLYDETKDFFPFGESVLATLYRTFKQLEMLEDASLIHKIVRAPERRVFYIDVGKKSPKAAKKVLEKVKLDIRQKKIPINRGGKDGVDSAYNPESMIEDFFLPVTGEGRGPKIDTLSGDSNLEFQDVMTYFQNKMFRGLKIPMSYMVNSLSGEGAQINDGRVGTAYIQELRFVRYAMRLQELLDNVFDFEFKEFLHREDINIHEDEFSLKFNPPQNFAIYRELELAGDLLNTFQSANDIPFMSKRYALMKYMNWSEEDIQLNETLLKQERGIDGNKEVDVLDPDTDEPTGKKVIQDEVVQIYGNTER